MKNKSNYNPTVSFRLPQETIDKLDECLKIRNKELSRFNTEYKRTDLVNEILNEYYYQLMGSADRPILDEHISMYLEQTLKLYFDRFNGILKKMLFNSYRNSKLLEMLVRTTCGTYEEQIKRRMADGRFSREEAEEGLNDYITNQLFKPAIFIEVLDSKLQEENEEGEQDEY